LAHNYDGIAGERGQGIWRRGNVDSGTCAHVFVGINGESG
jgi:hypothetical protein